jgi:hypothetical protein
VLLLVVSETGLVYTFTTAKLQPLVTQPEGKNLIQACLNAPNGTLPGGAPATAPGMPPPPPSGRQRPTAMSIGMNNAGSPNHDAEGEDDGEGSGDSPNLGPAKGRRRRRTNSSSGAVPGSNMSKAIGSPSESMPSTSPTLSMQQAHGMFSFPPRSQWYSDYSFRRCIWRSCIRLASYPFTHPASPSSQPTSPRPAGHIRIHSRRRRSRKYDARLPSRPI